MNSSSYNKVMSRGIRSDEQRFGPAYRTEELRRRQQLREDELRRDRMRDQREEEMRRMIERREMEAAARRRDDMDRKRTSTRDERTVKETLGWIRSRRPSFSEIFSSVRADSVFSLLRPF